MYVLSFSASATTLFIPGNDEDGVQYIIPASGIYNFTLVDGACCNGPGIPGYGWHSLMYIYYTHDIVWGPIPDGNLGPMDADVILGSGIEYPTPEEAIEMNIGDTCIISLIQGQTVYLICPDGKCDNPDVCYHDNLGGITISVNPHTTGSISLDQPEYTVYTEWATVTVVDPDLNEDPYNQDSVSVKVYSYVSTDLNKEIGVLDLVVRETTDTSGIFTGTFGFNPGYTIGEKINVTTTNTGMIKVDYIDHIDEEGNIDQLRYVTAPYDFKVRIIPQTTDFIIIKESTTQWSAKIPISVKASIGSLPIIGADIVIYDTTDGPPFGDIRFGPTNLEGIAETEIPIPDARIENIDSQIWIEWNGDTYSSDPVMLYSKQKLESKSDERELNKDQVKNYNRAILEQYANQVQVDIPDPTNKGYGILFSVLSLLAHWVHYHTEYSPQEHDIVSVNSYHYTNYNDKEMWQVKMKVIRSSSSLYQQNWFTNDMWTFYRETNRIMSPAGIEGGWASPVLVNVIAPNGVASGYDPQTKELVINFPMAISNPGDEPFRVSIPNPLEGEYQFEVIGTGDGHYSMSIDKFDTRGILTNDLQVQQNINEGEIDTYSVNYRYPDTYLSIYPGWNFISIPKSLYEENNTASIFTAIDTAGRPIFTYNVENGQWNLIEYSTIIEPLETYWIYSNEFIEISLDYSTELAAPPVKHLYPGWNAIGIGSLYADQTEKCLSNLDGKWNVLLEYDNGLQMYLPPQVYGISTGSMQPGRGYWIYMKEPGDLVAMTG